MSDSILAVPAVILLLGVLIFFHELGHFTVAKLLKIRVEEFAFGFGPKLITLFKRGDTEYTVHPFPLGGFVRLYGMEHDQASTPGSFQSKPWYCRWLVYAAGPSMSLILAWLIFVSIPMTFGLPITGDVQNVVDLVMPKSEAERVGIRSGDVILSINGEKIESGREVLDLVHNSPDKELELVIDRSGRTITMQATPQPTEVEDGKVIGLLGFSPKQTLQRVGLVESVRYSNETIVMFVRIMARVLPSREAKDAVGGPLAIMDATITSIKRGAYGYFQLMGLLSLSLAVLNLLPIPVVDGGQMLLLVVEGIKRRRLSLRTHEIATRVGLAIIFMIFAVVMYLDLGRIVSGTLFR